MTARVLKFEHRPRGNPARQDLLSLHVRRGYHVAYREGQTNPCPGCRRSHWWIGRSMAECGFCGTALPIERQPGV